MIEQPGASEAPSGCSFFKASSMHPKKLANGLKYRFISDAMVQRMDELGG
jgi:hypothetical protein